MSIYDRFSKASAQEPSWADAKPFAPSSATVETAPAARDGAGGAPAPAASLPPSLPPVAPLKGLEYTPPPWASEPDPRFRWVLDVAKDGQVVSQVVLDKRIHTFGRHTSATSLCEHNSLSRIHAAVAHHSDGRVFLIDLASAHGTFLGQPPVRLPKLVPTELLPGAEVRFGGSTRAYLPRCTPAALARGAKRRSIFDQTPDPAAAAAPAPAGGLEHASLHITKVRRVAAAAAPEGERRAKGVGFCDEGGGALEQTIGFSDGSSFAVGVGPQKGMDKGGGAGAEGQFSNLMSSTVVVQRKPPPPASAPPPVRTLAAAASGGADAASPGAVLSPNAVTPSEAGPGEGGRDPWAGLFSKVKLPEPARVRGSVAWLRPASQKGGGLYSNLPLGDAKPEPSTSAPAGSNVEEAGPPATSNAGSADDKSS